MALESWAWRSILGDANAIEGQGEIHESRPSRGPGIMPPKFHPSAFAFLFFLASPMGVEGASFD
ncbi:MAG: hypothetical protein WAW79_13135, partial [Steroidobacteraceae bacterium]